MDILPISRSAITESRKMGDELLYDLRDSHHRGDGVAEASAAFALGNWYLEQSRPAEAVSCFQLCLVLRGRRTDDAGTGAALLALAKAQRDRGQATDAVRCCRESAECFQKCGDHIGESEALAELRAIEDAEIRRAA